MWVFDCTAALALLILTAVQESTALIHGTAQLNFKHIMLSEGHKAAHVQFHLYRIPGKVNLSRLKADQCLHGVGQVGVGSDFASEHKGASEMIEMF